MADEKNMQELDEKQLSDVAGGNWGEAEQYASLLRLKYKEAKTREELAAVMTDEERMIYEKKRLR